MGFINQLITGGPHILQDLREKPCDQFIPGGPRLAAPAALAALARSRGASRGASFRRLLRRPVVQGLVPHCVEKGEVMVPDLQQG